MLITRTEPTTGGPNRTPRDKIEPVFAENDLVEPDVAFDASSSEGWPWDSDPTKSTWPLQLESMKQWIIASAAMDSQAEAEQAGGDDSHGGVYAAGFNHDLIVVGTGDDDGDLNESNIDRKLGAIRVQDESGRMVPLPYGGTAIMPTCSYLDHHYLGEFARDEATGLLVPAARRPKRARGVWTDGAMKDYVHFGDRLAASEEDICADLIRLYPDLAELLQGDTDLWPQEDWFIAILGEGADHDATLRLYQQIAEAHKNVHVYSFDQVSNPAEIAEDMAVAMLGHKA